MPSNSLVTGNLILQICRGALWAPIIVLIAHGIAGKVFGHEPYVDPIMHFSGGLAIAFFCWRACLMSPELFGKPSRLGVDLLAFGLACAAALFWEFGEFIGDQVRGTNVQRGRRKYDAGPLPGNTRCNSFHYWRTRRSLI
jgi:hypothetical protein